MTRLIFVNKVGKNENNYIIGSNVGSQSRFARSALKKRASNNALGKCCEIKDKPGLISLVISYVVTNINLSNLSDAQKNELINLIKSDYANNLNISSDLIDIQLIQGSLIIHVIIKSEISVIQNIKNKINTNPSINNNVKNIIKPYLDNIIPGEVSIEEPVISDKVIPSITEICITPISIVNALNGKYLFNNSSTYNPFFRYSLNNGYYEFTNIPQIHAMAILNKDISNLITYTGTTLKVTKKLGDIKSDIDSSISNDEYNFYYGTIKVYVYGDFDSVSVFCYQHGYMGGKNLLTYKNSCSSVNINNPPIFTSTQVTSAIQGTPYTYTVTINDENKDQTNDSITLSAPVKPSWLTFESGVLSGTPTLNSHLGDNNVTLRANDGTVDVDQTFVINVANTNDPPIFTSTQVTSAIKGSPYTYTVTTSDPDNDSITLSAPVKPSWLTFESGVLSGTPTLNSHLGDNNVTLRANDGTVDVDQTFVINVANTTTPQSYTINVINSGATAYTLSGNDRQGSVSGNNVNLNVNDTVNFVVNANGHPFWIKTTQSTGTGNAVNNPVALNNGLENGTVSWKPNVNGTYYYICQHHESMVGTIIVT